MNNSNFIEGFTDAWFTMLSGRTPCIYISGNPIYSEIEFLDIKPGDKIHQVGDKVSGSAAINRIDNFKTFITYKGILKTKMMSVEKDKEIEVLIFSINPDEIIDDVPNNKYFGYILLRHQNSFELKVPDHRFNVNRIYQPVFKKI